MATFSGSVKVKGDATLLQQHGMLGPDINMGMGMGMHVDSNVGMNVHMSSPEMAVQVNQPGMHVSMGLPSLGVSTNFSDNTGNASLSLNIGVPAPPKLHVSVPSLQQIHTAPPVAFGNEFSITVSEPRRVGEPPNERTEYYFTLRTNLREWGVHPCVRVSMRYNQVKMLYDRLNKYFGHILPSFPSKNFAGRFKSDIVTERLNKFQQIMNAVCADSKMRQNQALKDFFFGRI